MSLRVASETDEKLARQGLSFQKMVAVARDQGLNVARSHRNAYGDGTRQ